ncbi:MAG: YncE family protein [Thermoplasmata archaeon]
MSLSEVARIALPSHPVGGGFDHAAVDGRTDRLYVAHTSNDAVDMIDLKARRFLRSLPNLRGVAGVWVAEQERLLFTSNRAEDTASILPLDGETEAFRFPTGPRPNGMAFDPGRGTLLVAGVGDPRMPNAPPTLTFAEAATGTAIGQLRAPGRTRWATYHAPSDAFYVNVADPPCIAVVAADRLSRIDHLIPIPARGPHGLEQDPSGRLLYCACDEGVVVSVEVVSGRAERVGTLSGAPDVLWVNSTRQHLYCAVEDPGAIDVFEISPFRFLESVRTAPGAGTLTVDLSRGEVHSFLPNTHEDLVLQDRGPGTSAEFAANARGGESPQRSR